MPVDSFYYLPRSMCPLYESPDRPAGEEEPVFVPFAGDVSEATIALLTSAGLYVADEHEPFDGEREKREPTWGDPSHRILPHDRCGADLDLMHLHISHDDIREDHNVALPTDVLDDLVDDGRIGAVAATHVSVMGYQGHGDEPLAGWRDETAPAIVSHLEDARVAGVVLAPV